MVLTCSLGGSLCDGWNSDNEAWGDGEALAMALRGFAIGKLFTRVPLRTLTTLTLRRCTGLRSLPDNLGVPTPRLSYKASDQR